MNICPRCGQLIRTDSIAVMYKGEPYHGMCYLKEKRADEAKTHHVTLED
jgi:hypothetical protein